MVAGFICTKKPCGLHAPIMDSNELGKSQHWSCIALSFLSYEQTCPGWPKRFRITSFEVNA